MPDVILSHNHADHTGGLVTLREDVRSKNPTALSRAHVGQGIFLKRETPWMEPFAGGMTLPGAFIVYDSPKELFPGAWLTGPVARVYPERNFTIGPRVGSIEMADGSKQEDTIPEDMSLVIDTDRGLVVITGCGHAGIINTLEYARKKVRNAPIHAALGGFHLFQLDDEAEVDRDETARVWAPEFLGRPLHRNRGHLSNP